MARYFIDTDDGDSSTIDCDGWEWPNDAAARNAALDALPDMAREKMPNGDERLFRVVVRDERDRVIYIATLHLSGGWADQRQH
jgi:hypothetical protein